MIGTKGAGAVTKTGVATTKAAAVKGATKAKELVSIPNLLPYNPKNQLSMAGGVPYNVVNGAGLKDQLISMAKVESEINGRGTEEVSKKISDVPHVKEAKDIIAERTKGLDLNEYPTMTKQMSSKKMKELRDKIDNRTITKQEYADYIWNKKFAKKRDKGVKEFWYQEQQRILNNEPLTREWRTTIPGEPIIPIKDF
ncbi:hypothetical protein ACQKKK_08355 [Peribacillus sp. NPDC006672]|uniref:hypothetical protein n=1 Tax=Peribacillus sp. NPDC006672 TaxID=3390606 RepID=UPI003D074ED2